MSWKLVSQTNQEISAIKEETYENKDGRRCKIVEKHGIRRLFLQKGVYTKPEPEINIGYMTEKQLNDYLNKKFLEGRRLCFLCGDDKNIGITCLMRPTDITEEERALQSIESKKHHEEMKENPGKPKNIDWYEPYPTVKNVTDSIKNLEEKEKEEEGEGEGEQEYRLNIEILPFYICVDCRRNGQCGSSSEEDKLHPKFRETKFSVPLPKERGIINKFKQRNAPIIRFIDNHENILTITDRLSIIRTAEEAKNVEVNILQQLELFNNPAKVHILETLMKDKKIDEFYNHLAYLIRRVIPTLLRAASKMMVKGGKVEVREMQEFEPSYEHSLVIIRAVIYLLTKYEKVREILMQDVYLWNANPFSKNAKDIFQNWMDVVWIGSLVGVPFSHIRYSVSIYLFNILAHNYAPTEEKMEKIDKKTYLRRVFNEGRNRNASHELLYTLAFSGMIYERIRDYGYPGFENLMDTYSCYLPEDCLIQVWREMSYVNDNIDSLGPSKDESGTFKPGLFKHLGMGSEESDIEETITHIFKFLDYARKYSLVMNNKPLSEEMVKQICSLDLSHIKKKFEQSAVKRHELLVQGENKRMENIRKTHQGSVPNGLTPLHPERGAYRIKDLQCAFPACGRQFNSIALFKKHLEEVYNKKSYNPEFSMVELHRIVCGTESDFENIYNFGKHNSHPLSNYAQNMELTPEKIRENKITKCPVPLCPYANANDKEFTPDQLCDHFAQFGIMPFWYKGWGPKFLVEKEVKEEIKDHKLSKEETKEIKPLNIWDNPGYCVICQENCCEEIILDCGHINLCHLCREAWTKIKKECPSCRGYITRTISIMAFIQQEDVDESKVYMAGLDYNDDLNVLVES